MTQAELTFSLIGIAFAFGVAVGVAWKLDEYLLARREARKGGYVDLTGRRR